MAFDKNQENVFKSRERYDLDDPEDRKVVREFEAEVQPYLDQKKEVLGTMLKGFELYLHEKRLLRYSENYPEGAVNASRLNEFREASMKIYTLRELWDRRDAAEKHETENIERIAQ